MGMNYRDAVAASRMINSRCQGAYAKTVGGCFDYWTEVDARGPDARGEVYDTIINSLAEAEEFCRSWNQNHKHSPQTGSVFSSFGFTEMRTRSAQPAHVQHSGSFPVMPFLVVALLGFLFVAMNDRTPTTQPVQYYEHGE